MSWSDKEKVKHRCNECNQPIIYNSNAVKVVYDTSKVSYNTMYKVFQFHRDCFNKLYIFRNPKINNHNYCEVCGLYCNDGSLFDRVFIRYGAMGRWFINSNSTQRVHRKCFDKYFLYKEYK